MVIPRLGGDAGDGTPRTGAVGSMLSTAGSGMAPFGRSATEAGLYLRGSSAGISTFRGARTNRGRAARLGFAIERPIAAPGSKAVLP